MSDPSRNQTAALQSLLAKAESVAGDPRRFSGYANDPIGFTKNVLGVRLWPKQQEVLLAIVKHRRTAVRSGHGVGKSFVLACAVLWWLYAKQGLVVTTASSWHQVEKVLWREIKSLHRNAKVPLPGQRLMTELRVEEDWWAIGLSTDNSTAFQGQHHANLLVVVDEAPGIEDDDVHEAIASLAVGGSNRLVYIGNPTEPKGAFYKAFTGKGWHTLKISCLDHPNVVSGREIIPGAVTREWVEERRAEYGELDPRWQVRVLGDFPTTSDRKVIPLEWINRAMEPSAWAAATDRFATRPVIFGVDVARFGSNKSVISVRKGDAITEIIAWQGARITDSVRRIVAAAQEHRPSLMIVDDIGVGGGLFDLLVEAGLPVVGYNAGARAARSDAYDNMRSEGWFGMRDRLEHGRLFLPDLDGLRTDLSSPGYSFAGSSKIKVQSKAQLDDSTDYADAVMMSLSMDLTPNGEAADADAWRQNAYQHGMDPVQFRPIEDDDGAEFVGGIPMHGY